MKQLLIIISFISGLTVSCNHSENRKTANVEPNEDSKSGLKTELQQNKKIIDSLIKLNSAQILTFVKLLKSENFIPVQNDSFPDDIETEIVVIKDSLGHVMVTSEFSITESADWRISWIHYFDKTGKTFVFQRKVSFYNGGCTNGDAKETKTSYYNANFQVTQQEYSLVDENNNELQKDSCKFDRDYEHEVSRDLNSFLKTKKIKNSM